MRLGFAFYFVASSAGAALVLFACSGTSLPVIDDTSDGAAGRADGNGPTMGRDDGGNGNQDEGGNGNEAGGPGCAPNPANAEIEGNGCDDDGDGTVDVVAHCDTIDDSDGGAIGFAHAIGLCESAPTRGFGVVSATFTRGYASALAAQDAQHGVLASFGSVVKPREGSFLGVLSSGYGLAFDGPLGTEPFNGGQDWYGYGGADLGVPGNGTAPPGFPKAAAGCAQETIVNDVIDLKLTLKAPPNARGFSFDADFWSGDWPTYVCSKYNDAFVAYLSAQGFNGGNPDNIAFDTKGAPIGINAVFFDRCTPNTPVECDAQFDGGAGGPNPHVAACAGGASELAGTGFLSMGNYCSFANVDAGANDAGVSSTGGGATGWLTTSGPVKPGETFTLELFVWDAADAVLDSSVLLDHFHWLDTAPTTGTTRAPK